MKIKTARLIICALFLISVGAFAASAPNHLSYQGTLTDNNGNYLSGNYDFKFEIYNVPSGGSPLQSWFDTQTNVPVTNGIYNVEIGSYTSIPAGIFDNTDCYLQMYVAHAGGNLGATDAKLSPRQHLLPSPYASGLIDGSYTLLASTITAAKFYGDGSGLSGITATNIGNGNYNLNFSTMTLYRLDASSITATRFYGNGSGLSGVTATGIGAGAVGTTELATNAVTTIKITDANVTAAKLATTDNYTLTGSTLSLYKVTASSITAPIISATNFYGNGSGLSGVTATGIGAGTVGNAQMVSTDTYNLTGSTLTIYKIVASSITAPVISATNFYGNGSGLSGVTATGIGAGTVGNAQMVSTDTYNLTGSTLTIYKIVASSITARIISATNFYGNGSGLTNVTPTIAAGSIGNTQMASTDTYTLTGSTLTIYKITVGTVDLPHGLLDISGNGADHLVIENSGASPDNKLWLFKAIGTGFEIDSASDNWGNIQNFITLDRNGPFPVDMHVKATIQSDFGVSAATASFSGAVTMQSAVITNPLLLPSGNPALTPTAEGLLMYDFIGHKAYISTGTSNSGDWHALW